MKKFLTIGLLIGCVGTWVWGLETASTVVAASRQLGTDDAIEISMSGIMVQKVRLKVIAENVANATTVMTDTGLPYQKKYAVVESDRWGAKVSGIYRSNAAFTRVYDPASPFSDKNGFLLLTNVNLAEEYMNMAYTSMVYEANTSAYRSSKAMYQQSLDLLK